MRKSLENLAGRKASGGRRVASRARRKFELDRYPNEAIAGTTITTTRRTRGNNIKTALKAAETVNVLDPSSKKTTKLAKFLLKHGRQSQLEGAFKTILYMLFICCTANLFN